MAQEKELFKTQDSKVGGGAVDGDVPLDASAPGSGWAPQEVATLVRARQILKAHGMPSGFSVKEVSEAAGVSRKTAYEQERRIREDQESQAQQEAYWRQEAARLKTECETMGQRIRILERDLGALELTRRAYDELKKIEGPAGRTGKPRR